MNTLKYGMSRFKSKPPPKQHSAWQRKAPEVRRRLNRWSGCCAWVASSGYDIVDDAGNINFSGLSFMEDPSLRYCLSALFDSSLEITYLVPVVRELRTESHTLGTIESVGFGLNGVPIKGNPPSVTVVEAGVGDTGSGNIPLLDLCGGHPDSAGYYHWHNIPQAMNTLLSSENYNYTELYGMECSNSNNVRQLAIYTVLFVLLFNIRSCRTQTGHFRCCVAYFVYLGVV